MTPQAKTQNTSFLQVAWVLLLCLIAPLALGQSLVRPPVSPEDLQVAPTVRIVPRSHYYLNFFRFESVLQQQADSLEKEGRTEEAKHLRDHLQEDLKLTNRQAAILRKARTRMLNDYQDGWNKAMPILLQDRQWHSLNGWQSPAPGHDQVHQIQTDQEAAVEADYAALRRQLGAQLAARLDAYIGDHVKANIIQPPKLVSRPGEGQRSSPYFHATAPEVQR